MKDLGLVGGMDRKSHLHEDPQEVLPIDPGAKIGQRLTVDQLHSDDRQVFHSVGIVDLANARVAEPSLELPLLKKPYPCLWAGLGQAFEGNSSAQKGVPGLMNHAHAALPQDWAHHITPEATGI